jgi:flagellar hook-associated protein 3 FlgL
MLSQNLLRNLEAAQGRMDKLQNQMSTGNAITKPSDDPVAIENSLRLKSSISQVEQWKGNADEALSYMETTDSTLGDMTSMLQRIQELTVQAANGTNDDTDRKNISAEVGQLTDQLRMIANNKIGTKFVFGGIRSDQPPLASGSNTWEGNPKPIQYEIGNDLKLPISINGNELFMVQPDATDPTINKSGFFDTLDQLKTDLDNNNTAGIESAIGDLEKLADNVLNQRASLGAKSNRMTALRDQLDVTSLNMSDNLSKIEDADFAKSVIDFKNAENVYNAALSVGAQIIQPSLVDFMK